MINRQHTTPQYYLRYFCPCWVYQLGEKEPRWITTPSNESVHSKYYGELDELNTKIENKGAPIYNRLIENPYSIETENEQFILAILLANLFVRNPNNVEKWRSVRTAGTEQIIEKLKIMQHSDSAVSDILQQWNKDYEKLKAKGGHLFAVDDNFSTLPYIAECIHKMSFFIFEAPKGLYVLTSENPLLLENYWANTNALAQITLCPTHILIMKYYEPCSIWRDKVTPEQVENTNLDIIRNAKHKIYSKTYNAHAYKWMREGDDLN